MGVQRQQENEQRQGQPQQDRENERTDLEYADSTGRPASGTQSQRVAKQGPAEGARTGSNKDDGEGDLMDPGAEPGKPI